MRSFHIAVLYLMALMPVVAQEGGFVGQIADEEKDFIKDQLKANLWDAGDELQQRDIPQAYMDEPAVFLTKTASREFYRNSRNTLRTINLEHHVIKLLNMKGVEDNSIFTYEHIESEYAFDVTAIRVIKADGAVQVIDVDSVSFNGTNSATQNKHFVLPALEPGDILDFYYYLEIRVLFPQQYSRIFDPVYLVPQGIYPILDYHLNFTLGPSAFINVSKNDFPEFKEESLKIDRKTFTKFTANLSVLDPVNRDVDHFYPFRALPSLKYQVFVGPYLGNSDIRYNIGGALKLNSSIQRSRLQDYLAYMLAPAKDYRAYYSSFKRFLREQGLKVKSTPKRVLALQYFQYNRIRSELMELTGLEVQINPATYTSLAFYVFDKMNVPVEVVLAFDRSVSALEEAALTDELHPMIRVLAEDTLYLDSPSFNIPAGETGPRYQSCRAYTYQPVTRKLTEIDMPVSGQDLHRVRYEVTMDVTGASPVFIRTTATGHPASILRQRFMNRYGMFTNNAVRSYNVVPDVLYPKEKQQDRILEPILEAAEEQKDALERSRAAIYSGRGLQVEDFDFTVNSYGMDEYGDPLVLEERFVSQDPVEDLQDRILVSLEGLLPEAFISPDILHNRREDLYFDYPESRAIDVELKIPEGYSFVEAGWSDTQINESTGFFRSSSEQDGDKLRLTISYGLNNLFEPVENAQTIRSILMQYEKLRKQKLLFKK